MLRALLGGFAATAILAAPAAAAPDLTVTPERDHEAVVLTGKELGRWAVPSNTTVRLPFMDLYDCGKLGQVPEDPTSGGAGDIAGIVETDECAHNNYAKPEVDTASAQPSGTPVGRLLGYRWNGRSGRKAKFEQIPFQVDEQFTRYLNNQASGFSPYSGEDQHTTYAYDREGFRWTESDAANPCLARPASPVAVDPIAGLDHNDELAFMARDAGPRAPEGATLPRGITGVKEVRVTDPTVGDLDKRFVYVMRAGDKGPKPRYGSTNGHVSYKRDAISDTFEKSESSYENYGNAARGIVCDAQGNVVGTDERRRPRDYATIKTDRYRFRYDGRWLMTKVEISADGGRSYGPDLVDRWKARAFQQDPGSETPCCGYEEEDTNWGGSSTLLGERVGPVRAIRETWGADSGTNVIRRETFYRDQMVQRTWLRVHVIPPLDGIYAQWDFNAGRVTRFFNSTMRAGVPVDGRNDEAFGNFDDPCNANYDGNDTSAFDQGYRTLYRQLQFCSFPYHQSVDMTDPTFNDLNAALGWSAVSGPNGTIVDRIRTSADMPPGGAAQAVVAVPYYRDDSCFDDGTGSDPGPKVNLRSGDEPRTASNGTPRRCWHPDDGLPDGSDQFFQGSIATHGLHLLFLVDSDNARMTVPTTEIISDWQMLMLPGDQGARGEAYGRSFERPLVALTRPAKDRFEPAPERGEDREERDDDDRDDSDDRGDRDDDDRDGDDRRR
jgi:hypothetical protein